MIKTELLCDSAHGVYIPSVFTRNTENIWSIQLDTWQYLQNADNTENPDYWDIWDDVLNHASYTDPETGENWTLHHDSDLWAVCLDTATQNEIDEFFGN